MNISNGQNLLKTVKLQQPIEEKFNEYIEFQMKILKEKLFEKHFI
jgi:hypothetical protein